MNGVQTRFKCKLDVKRCKRFVFPPSSLLPRSNALKTKAIRYFQTDRTLTRIVSPPLYMPWSINLGKGFSTEPLSCGLYLNTVFGNQFWVSEPERYPKGYYGFSSKVRIHVFMGQRLTYDIDPNRRFLAKSVTFFYEISTCDLYLISGVTNSYLRPRDYLSLSFGLKFQWL